MATEICLTNGVPIETLSKMLGHTNIRTTQIYAKITHEKESALKLNQPIDIKQLTNYLVAFDINRAFVPLLSLHKRRKKIGSRKTISPRYK